MVTAGLGRKPRAAVRSNPVAKLRWLANEFARLADLVGPGIAADQRRAAVQTDVATLVRALGSLHGETLSQPTSGARRDANSVAAGV